LLHIHPDYQLNFRVNLNKGGLDRLLSKLLETRSTDRRHSSAAGLSAHTVKKMGLRWSSWHSAKKAGQWPRTRYRERRERRVSHTHYLLSAADQAECTTCQCPLTVEHILVECTDFIATNISLLPLWRNYLKPLTYVMSLILSTKLIFTTSY